MRNGTLSGTPVGLTWSDASAGVIRSDGLIAEVDHLDLLLGDTEQPQFAPGLAEAASAGSRVVVKCPAGTDHATLRRLGHRASAVNTRFFVLCAPLPAPDSIELDQLVEDLRTIQDVVKLPIAIDPRFDSGHSAKDTARALREVCERAWCRFVLDLSAVGDFANVRRTDPEHVVSDLPPARVAYIRVRSTTESPITSSVKELVRNTMTRWETTPPALILDSNRPISAMLRELGDLLSLSGHEAPSARWVAIDLAARATGLPNL